MKTTFPGLTEATIRDEATDESFRRGQEYYDGGAVLSVVRRGDSIDAQVAGSAPEAYTVRVDFDGDDVLSANCTCPYDWGGWCKHIVATLLACMNEPEEIQQRPTLEALLSGQDREGLLRLLLGLAEADPSLAAAIEARVALAGAARAPAHPVPESPSQESPTPLSPPQTPPTPVIAAQPPPAPVDPQPFRRQVSGILHSLDRMRGSEAYWHIGGVVDQVRGVLDQAWDLIEAGDGRNALAVLEAITEEYLAGSESLDDSDGDVSAFFSDLGPAWTEALLTSDLGAGERQAWAKKMGVWQGELADYGIDDVFDAALAAAEQGWDYPPLQRVLQGEITELGAWEGERPLGADALAEARLKVLDRQGRHQEYLHLAEAESQTTGYVTMLVRLGRVEEAVKHGLEHLATTDEALALAKALEERGETERALRIARHGLTLQGSRKALATWLRDTAAGRGRTEEALSAAVVVFEEEMSLAAFLRARDLAGEGWPAVRDRLIELLRGAQPYYRTGPVEVFLHEGLIEDAMAAVERSGATSMLERVVEAATPSHPDWALQRSRRQAEPIMDQGKAQHYDDAVRWLGRARDAYRVAGREQEWRDYLRELIERHGRKYKLVPMLNSLKK